MLGEHPLMVGRGMATQFRKDPNYRPLTHVAEELHRADIAFANLECALTDRNLGRSHFSRECIGPATGAGFLQEAGLRVVSVANNHILQHGRDVFRETLGLLEAAGVHAVGVAAENDPRSCAPLDMDIKGTSFRFLAYSLRPRQHFDDQPLYAEPTTESLLSDVDAGCRAGRTVVVSLHWGDEFVRRPSPAQIALGRRIVDAGATLVLGHHPHVLQGWERRGGALIAYSLGNFMFDMNWESRLRRTALLRCSLSAGAVAQATWLPLLIGDDFQPRPADETLSGEILAELAAGASEIASQPDVPATSTESAVYEAEIVRELAVHRRASYRYFGRNLLNYEPAILMAILRKAVERRVGLRKD